MYTRAITEAASKRTQRRVPRFNTASKKRKNHTWVRQRLNSAVLTWLWENNSCAISVSGPGERMGIKSVQQVLFVEYRRIFFNRNDGNCLTEAIINAVDVVA